MSEFNLKAISPVDGRYAKSTVELSEYFSEYALIRYRLFIEIEYFIALCNIPLEELNGFDKHNFIKLRKIHSGFDIKEAEKIKEIEKITNHDVKSVEYYLKEIFDLNGWGQWKEFIHFGLTSQDINNTAIPLSVSDGIFINYLPKLTKLVQHITDLASEWKDQPMLGWTHGQAASPTLVGKEFMVFVERLKDQLILLKQIPLQSKFGGAVGNFNAHFVSYPEIDWFKFADNFINSLGLQRQKYTTQIEHYDNLAAIFDNLKRINNILINFCRDIWLYVSMEYFKQKVNKNEVGSSTMPHKVNPIDFENAEGNLGIANSLFEHLSSKLPISRLQRDLTDSTVTRKIGDPVAHSMIAIASIERGLNKLIINSSSINSDLENNWMVISEAIQTILRKTAYPEPYEALKELTRNNKKIGKKEIHQFIDELQIDDETKKQLKEISPFNYTGKMFPIGE